MSNGSGNRDGEPTGSKMINNVSRRTRPMPLLIAHQNSWTQFENTKITPNLSEFNQTEAEQKNISRNLRVDKVGGESRNVPLIFSPLKQDKYSIWNNNHKRWKKQHRTWNRGFLGRRFVNHFLLLFFPPLKNWKRLPHLYRARVASICTRYFSHFTPSFLSLDFQR